MTNDHAIRDKDGAVIGRSRNLAGIRRYVSKHSVRTLAIHKLDVQGMTPDGWLRILFDDGASYETVFASFEVLRDFVRRWRNVYGTPLLVNGAEAGEVGMNNPALSPAKD